jgi:anti-sigma factor (TIGR02949 family)
MEEFTCPQAWARLSEYLDRELSSKEEALVRRHLASCGECRERFDFEDRLLTTIRERSRTSRASESLRQQVAELIDRL